jgi:hypothetical protein
MEKSIKVDLETWKTLMSIKIDRNMKNNNEVVQFILNKSGIKEEVLA